MLVATAHPAKFREIVEPLIGRPVPVPESLERLFRLPARFQEIDANLAALRAAWQVTAMIDLDRIALELRSIDPRTLALAAGAAVLVGLLLLVWRWYRRRRARAACWPPSPAAPSNTCVTC